MVVQRRAEGGGPVTVTHYHGVPFEALLAARLAKHDPFQRVRRYAVSFDIVLPVA